MCARSTILTGLAVALVLTMTGGSFAERQNQGAAIPGEATALEGRPTVRVESTQDKTDRVVLDESEAARSALRIDVVDGRYYWTSRGKQPLEVRTNGEFTYLSADPGRYIRVTRLSDRLSYVEHVDSALGSVTYWGELRIVIGR